MSTSPTLTVVNYHYVRDLPNTRFPRIKGMLLANFVKQVSLLQERYLMATLEQVDAFLVGHYQPQRDICLLTFDDGLKEHAREITPILAERKIEGTFFLTTACIEEHQVLSVHKNHFLMASLEFAEYQQAFLKQIATHYPETDTTVDRDQAAKTYRFDTPEVAEFKFLLNFRLSDTTRQQILNALFAEYLGDEAAFASELYVSWEEAKQMQASGMVLGGHSHRHVALATMSDDEQRADLQTSTQLLRTRLIAQPLWPFSYPYGTPAISFNAVTIDALQALGTTVPSVPKQVRTMHRKIGFRFVALIRRILSKSLVLSH